VDVPPEVCKFFVDTLQRHCESCCGRVWKIECLDDDLRVRKPSKRYDS
jgi:hypothetical protein